MPLAIELAAARLRSMSLAELHDRLDQRFRLLTGGSRTALERQQTLRATVGWSYSLLTGAEQLLLARLSVFADGFGLDAAEAVCGFGGIDVLDVADLLGSLVDKSLVVAEPAGEGLRYRLLETIRLFAAERLVEAGDERGRRGRRGALRAFPVCGRGGGRSSEPGRSRAAGWPGWTPIRPTCGAPPSMRPAARTGPRWCCAWASRSTATG